MGNFNVPGLLITKDEGKKFLRTYEPLKDKEAEEIGRAMSAFL